MRTNGVRTLLTGRGLVESPRWHQDRLYFSDWSAGEVLSVDLDGRSEVVAQVKSLPLCTDWLPDGRLVIVSSADGQLLRREPDGSLVTHADLTSLACHPWNDLVVDGRGNAYVNTIGFEFPGGEDHGNDRQQDDDRDHGVDLGELLAEADRAEDPQRQGVLRARGEHRDDDLVEGQAEGEQRAGYQRGRGQREGDEAQRLPAARAEVHGRFGQRSGRPAKPGDQVVEHHHDAERGVPDHDGQGAELNPGEGEE